MAKYVRVWGVGRVVLGIALVFTLWVGARAAELQDLRLGITDKRTRLVYQLDRISSYEIEFDESSVRITFESLTISADLAKKLNRNKGGMLGNISYSEQDGKAVFHLAVPKPFYVRYFDLVKPERLVVDLYPKKPKAAPKVPVRNAPVEEGAVVGMTAQGGDAEETPEISGEEVAAVQIDSPQTGAPVVQQEASPDVTPKVKHEAELPGALPPAPGSAISWLYIALPIAIVLLLIIGFITLRRASRRDELIEEDIETNEKWSWKGAKFKRLMEAEETGQIQDISPAETVIEAQDQGEETLESSDELQPEEQPSAESIEKSKEEEEALPQPQQEDEIDETAGVLTPSDSDEEPIESREVSDPVETDEELEEEEPAPELEPPEPAEHAEEEDTLKASPAPKSDSERKEIPEVSASSELHEEFDEEEEELKTLEPVELTESGEEEEILESVPEREIHKLIDEISAELNFEEGVLTWPVYILEGERVGRIMVVDDEPEIVSSLKELLNQEDYDVVGLTDGRSALEKYREWHPDLVITDVVMPGFSGVDLVRRIQELNDLRKVIFLSGRTEREGVSEEFGQELEEGRYEFFRKPFSPGQFVGRVRDYFSTAQEILHLNLENAKDFDAKLQHLGPYQLVPLQRFLWDKIFEISSSLLGRRIESYFITDRMEPPANYMQRVGCQEREDYCIANVCFASNPLCAANKIRGELDVMRQIIMEFRQEYLERVSRSIGEEGLRKPAHGRKRTTAKTVTESHQEDTETSPPPRQTLRRLVPTRKR